MQGLMCLRTRKFGWIFLAFCLFIRAMFAVYGVASYSAHPELAHVASANSLAHHHDAEAACDGHETASAPQKLDQPNSSCLIHCEQASAACLPSVGFASSNGSSEFHLPMAHPLLVGITMPTAIRPPIA